MNQLPSGISSSPVPELHFMSDWTKSFNIVIESVTAAPIPVACVLGTVMAQLALPKIPGWSLLQTIITFFGIVKTYSSYIQKPSSRVAPAARTVSSQSRSKNVWCRNSDQYWHHDRHVFLPGTGHLVRLGSRLNPRNCSTGRLRCL